MNAARLTLNMETKLKNYKQAIHQVIHSTTNQRENKVMHECVAVIKMLF